MTISPIILIALMPWVHGVTELASTDTATPGAAAWLADDELQCAAEAQPPLRLTVGTETITATYTGGLRVTSAEGVMTAVSPGYPCTGSADAIETLAVGTIFHEKTIIVTYTSGGSNEQWTWLGIYRVGFAGAIDPLFAGIVERRIDGRPIERGSLTFIPGALIYRAPGGADTLWAFDPVVHAYTPRGLFGHEEGGHS